MCLAHDIAEVRSNDQNWVHKKYVKVFGQKKEDDGILMVKSLLQSSPSPSTSEELLV